MKPNLFTNGKDFFILSKELSSCCVCNKKLFDFGVLKQYFFYSNKKPKFNNFLFCSFNCGKNHSFIDADSKTYLCLVVDEVSLNFRFVYPELMKIDSKNKETIFSASELSSERTEDKTVFAGRESLEGASVGLSVSELEERSSKRLQEFERLLLGEK